MLLILFGLPGGGKSTLGRLLQAEHGFHFHEADDDIPDDYRRRVAAGEVMSDGRRDEYHRALLERIAALQAAHPRLAVAVPLLRQKHRDWICERFPQAHFILVVCPPELWEARLDGRQHTVRADYARKILPLYEAPTLKHFTVTNRAEGPDEVRAQLAAILAEIGPSHPG
jgi:gluconate kinase